MSWLQRLFARRRMERDLDKEIQFHVESQVADKVRSGISEIEARRLTRLEFGGTEQIKEDCRKAGALCGLNRWFRTFGMVFAKLGAHRASLRHTASIPRHQSRVRARPQKWPGQFFEFNTPRMAALHRRQVGASLSLMVVAGLFVRSLIHPILR